MPAKAVPKAMKATRRRDVCFFMRGCKSEVVKVNRAHHAKPLADGLTHARNIDVDDVHAA